MEAFFEHIHNVHILMMGCMLAMVVATRPLCRWLDERQEAQSRRLLDLVQVANGIGIFFVLLSRPLGLVLADGDGVEQRRISEVLGALLVLQVAYLGHSVLAFQIRQIYGRLREKDGQQIAIETYNSRILISLTGTLITVMSLLTSIQLLGFDSLLRATGVIGFLGVLLGLSQGAWAPDIISGLIILNSRLFEEGDVVELGETDTEGAPVRGVVFKTKLFHTEILDLVNNHRIMIPNAKIRAQTIHNLSKFASARGLREVLAFKIGYDSPESEVKAMFEKAFTRAVEAPEIGVEGQHPVEVRAADAGDFAILWKVFYHTKEVKNLLKTRQLFLGIILEEANAAGISLATPMLHQNELAKKPEAPPPQTPAI